MKLQVTKKSLMSSDTNQTLTYNDFHSNEKMNWCVKLKKRRCYKLNLNFFQSYVITTKTFLSY